MYKSYFQFKSNDPIYVEIYGDSAHKELVADANSDEARTQKYLDKIGVGSDGKRKIRYV